MRTAFAGSPSRLRSWSAGVPISFSPRLVKLRTSISAIAFAPTLPSIVFSAVKENCSGTMRVILLLPDDENCSIRFIMWVVFPPPAADKIR